MYRGYSYIVSCYSDCRLVNLMKRLLLLISSPLSIVYLSCAINAVLSLKATTDISIIDLLQQTWSDMSNGILHAVVQMDMLDNWTYGLVSLGYLTNWAMFWQVMSYEPPSTL